MNDIMDRAREIWSQVLAAITNLIAQAPELVTEYWEFVAVGLLALLLLVLIIVRSVGKRRLAQGKATADGRPKPAKKGKKTPGGVYEVGQRPVIVYRSSQQTTPEDQPETELPERPEPEQQPSAEQPAPEEDAIPKTGAEDKPLGQIAEEDTRHSLPAAPEETPITPQAEQQQQAHEGPTTPEDKEWAEKQTEGQPPQQEEAALQQNQPSKHQEPAPAIDPKFIPFLESDLANEVIHLFNNQGFPVEIVYQGQYGADMLAGELKQIFIQVKDWKKKVPQYVISEARQYADANNCSQVVIVAPAFEGGAKRAALRLNLELWNKRALKKQQRRFNLVSE